MCGLATSAVTRRDGVVKKKEGENSEQGDNKRAVFAKGEEGLDNIQEEIFARRKKKYPALRNGRHYFCSKEMQAPGEKQEGGKNY